MIKYGIVQVATDSKFVRYNLYQSTYIGYNLYRLLVQVANCTKDGALKCQKMYTWPC